MNSLEIMRKHLGKDVEIELSGGDKIKMSPLLIEDIPELIEVQSGVVSNVKGDDILIEKEHVATLILLIKKSLIKAEPELKDNLKVVDAFVGRHIMELMPKLFELNSTASKKDVKRAKQLAGIRERIQDERSKTGDPAKEEGTK